MKHLLLVSILLLLCAGNLSAFTGYDERDSFFVRPELREPPAAPLNLVISRSGESITLAWDEVSVADYYQVYCGDIPDFECNAGTLIYTVPVPGLILDNETGTMDRAFFKVIAVGAGAPVPENFVFVPAGTFIMGDTRDTGGSSERPPHSVSLDSFYMCKYEVTQAEYTAIMGSNPAHSYGVGGQLPRI
ncbi:MAG: SUMF1/EgtB/PvdO family nonheme iron enzyme [Candidatus Cloacimonadaceae bacterium]|jgi:hypothetical protein|nr:formylglycine-generating enzyme family protein [Candidatus Cloacimonadota bacterium]MCB5254839.1 formylglycine-generating enzyme family protein [Candidatus Cloacimonadota bacterium]MDD3103500.1 SUMF1/EgtB/PvdO family nonheme iron enzyme [Candidatus Cloacimonadota bacterium]MDD3532538.1 SUMF1/EgtB/PvdO family nonheme iron enzyme [Candidatus Cloacimonadota bacterium]MDY0127123.1 SUMF1/EgtB/PvdO family nonheme iron enzyme [Candidatus Cloacimonadaceae bacterium]